MEIRYIGVFIVRLVAVAMATAGIFINSTESIVFAIFMWMVSDTSERMAWRERREVQEPLEQKGDPWNHVTR